MTVLKVSPIEFVENLIFGQPKSQSRLEILEYTKI
jgi:hypothetical protein